MELAVVSIKGKETGRKAKLDKTVFGIEPNEHAIYLDVKSHLANRRQGTHQSKERGEIVGSIGKIKKQKGTGTARTGSIKKSFVSRRRSCIWPSSTRLLTKGKQESKAIGSQICFEH